MPQKNHRTQTKKKKITVTPAKRAANRSNAAKSTGPRTLEGKEASRFNALTHGATARQLRDTMDRLGEDPAEYDRFRQGFLDSLPPATFLESYLLENLADTAWRLERLARCQNAKQVAEAEEHLDDPAHPDPVDELTRDLCLDPNDGWKQLIRLEIQLSRHFQCQFNLLARLRKMRVAETREEEARSSKPLVGGRPVIVRAPAVLAAPPPVVAEAHGEADSSLASSLCQDPPPDLMVSSTATPIIIPETRPDEARLGMSPATAIPRRAALESAKTSDIKVLGDDLGSFWQSEDREDSKPGAWDLDRALPPGIPAHGMWKEL